MVWVEIEPSWDFEKEEAARTAQTDFVDDGSIPNISDPNLEISKHIYGYPAVQFFISILFNIIFSTQLKL